MIHIVYRTTHTETGRFYIGVHSTENVADGYLGSGKIIRRAVRKYGPDEFDRVIMACYHNLNDAYHHEATLVTEDLINDPLCMNLRVGGDGGFSHINHSTYRLIYLQRARTTVSNWSPEYRQKVNSSKRRCGQANGMFNRDRSGPNNPRYGTQVSEETRQKIRLANTGKRPSASSRQKMSSSQQRLWTPEARQQRSELYKRKGIKPSTNHRGMGWWCNRVNETVRSNDCPGTDWQKGRKWRSTFKESTPLETQLSTEVMCVT